MFPVQQGVPGIGAASSRCAANLAEDAIFAAKEEIYAIRLQDISKTTAVVPRAYLIAPALNAVNLGQCVSVVWNGLYILSTGNGKCFVADSRQRTGDLDSGYYQYEWYIWDNIPARAFMELDGELWFGTADGCLCKFNSDRIGMNRFSDGSEKVGGAWTAGNAIRALWATPADEFGTTAAAKSLLYDGVTLVCSHFERSSIRIYYIADGMLAGVLERELDAEQADNLSDLLLRPSGTKIHLNFDIRGFNTLQLVFENNVLDEGLGVSSAEVKYSYGNEYRG